MSNVLTLPKTAEQLLVDAAKLVPLVQTIKADRHSMCIPAQADDWDLLLTRVAATVPVVLAELHELRAYKANTEIHAAPRVG